MLYFMLTLAAPCGRMMTLVECSGPCCSSKPPDDRAAVRLLTSSSARRLKGKL